jgi:hypothetical protein
MEHKSMSLFSTLGTGSGAATRASGQEKID